MPIDLGSFGESLQRGLGEIPPVMVALTLLAAPTLLFIGYRVVGISNRTQVESALSAQPFWVCHECRSINELNHEHCYHCAVARDAQDELELIVEQPSGAPVRIEVSAASPVGVPVMGRPAVSTDAIAVGPGRSERAVAVPVVAEDGESLMLADTPQQAIAEPQR
jgi:hypothetical protein